MNKKIAIVSNSSWSVFNFRLGLAKALVNNGYQIILIAPSDEYSDRLKQEFEYYDININNQSTNPIKDIKIIIDFYKLYKEIKPDIVLNFTIKPNIYSTIACHLLAIKTINNITGLGVLFTKQGFLTKIARYLYKYSQNKANKVFFQNKDDFNLLTAKGLVEKDKCDILPGSGVDTKKFIPIKHKKTHDTFRFLLIARMLWDKGISEYVLAAKILQKKYSHVEFQLLGFLNVENPNAISQQQMQAWVDSGIVDYLGQNDDVTKVIATADCVVLPSFYREGTPRTLLESASMAKPIITTDSVGCRDVVDDGVNGYLCRVKSSQDLADKMDMMLNLSHEKRLEMGQKGRQKMIREYDEKIVIDKYLSSVIEVLA